jgi:hypothetical protein
MYDIAIDDKTGKTVPLVIALATIFTTIVRS